MTLRVSPVYPAAWLARPGMPLLASERWQRAMGGRFDGDPVWLWTTRPGGGEGHQAEGPESLLAGLAGHVVEKPADYPLVDALRVVADPDSPFADEAVRRRLAQSPVQSPGQTPAQTLALRAAWYPYLLLTCPGYATFPVGDAAADPGALRDLLSAVIDWARGQGLRGVALPYTEADSPLAHAAAGLGAVAPVISTDSQLAVPGGGFPAYLDGFPSRRRRTLRAERRALHARGLRGRRADRITDGLLDRLAELRCHHRRKYGLTADPAAERARLGRLTELLPASVDVITVGGTAADGSDAVSFGLFVRDHDTWHAVYTGNDYDNPRSRHAYFEAAYYAPLELAGRAGVSRISYGLAAEEAKRHRGCTSVPIACLLRGLTPEARAAAVHVAAAWPARTETGHGRS